MRTTSKVQTCKGARGCQGGAHRGRSRSKSWGNADNDAGNSIRVPHVTQGTRACRGGAQREQAFKRWQQHWKQQM